MNQEKVYLADIAGYQEEKEEAVKLIDVLKITNSTVPKEHRSPRDCSYAACQE